MDVPVPSRGRNGVSGLCSVAVVVYTSGNYSDPDHIAQVIFALSNSPN